MAVASISKSELLEQLAGANDFLQSAVLGVSDEAFNVKPASDKWSAAGILEHMLLIETSVNKMLPVEGTDSDREADKKHEMIDTIFSDDQKYYDSPGLYFPSGNIHNKEVLLNQLLAERAQLSKLINELDLSQTGTHLKHPGFGNFTRLEWILFVIHHSNRHARQIERIACTRIHS